MTPDVLDELESRVDLALADYEAAGAVMRSLLKEIDAAQAAVAASAKRYDDAVGKLQSAREEYEREEEEREQRAVRPH